MASIKVKFRPSTIAGREGTIYYQIAHERTLRQLATRHRIFSSEWDRERQMVRVAPSGERRAATHSIRELVLCDIERLRNIAGKLDVKGLPYSADDVLEEFERYLTDCSLFNFMESVIDKLKQNNKQRTSETYRSTLNSFKQFRAGHDIMLDRVTSEVMEAYEAWHRQRGNTPNTISFYARILRAVYNRAVEGGMTPDKQPFKHIYTGVDKTIKRALPLSTIKRIKLLDLSKNRTLDYARDMFMMSFYLRGMSFIDMAFLRKSDLAGGEVTYRRRKTGQRLTIGWTPQMQAILDKYPENTSQYLLPVIKRSGINERACYRNTAYNINHNLRKIADILELDRRFTMYVARHSWASAAQSKGIPLSIIKEGMGHDSEATTRIYLTSLDSSLVDQANSIILDSL